ncbi:MAG: N-acetyltransferase [Bacteroidetes bacterium]|nr:MAG: N-acetyltransferase [Bacteroidota bacterium]
MQTFNFKENIILENDKVLLKPLEKKDFKHFIYFSENEPDIWKFSLLQLNNKENLKKYIAFAIDGRKQKKSYAFAVFDKTKNKYAGSTRFYDYNEYHKTISVGYTWYGKEFRGTTLNKNCKYLMLQFIFEQIGVERVEFRADLKNAVSINAIKSLGCVEEGVLRNNFRISSGCRDSIVFSILKNEWFDKTKNELLKKIYS